MADTDAAPLTRRERVRAQTLAEIEDHAFALVDRDGASDLSLAAIAQAMGMSGPALYRYFASRDALIERLVTAAYGQLADAVEEAARNAARRGAEARLRAVVTAYREWALAHPRRYAMLFGERPDETRDTAQALAAIDRAMQALLAAVLDLRAPDDPPPHAEDRLDRQLLGWAELYARTDAPAGALRAAVLMWTRLHGIVSLELAHVFDDMRLDPGLLLAAEMDAVIRARTQG
jgi:AcrR family transcriptional regulator